MYIENILKQRKYTYGKIYIHDFAERSKILTG